MGTDKRDRQKAQRDAQRAAALSAAHRRRNIRIAAIGAVVVLVAILVIVVFTGDSGKTSNQTTGSTTGDTTATSGADSSTSAPPSSTAAIAPTCPKLDGSSPRSLNFTGAPSATCLAPGKKATATIKTTAGDIVVDLDVANTPKTAGNFAFLAGWHYYDNTKLFRVDTSIDIIQGGSPHTEGADDPGPGYNIKDEGTFTTDASGQLVGPYRYKAGDLVMARSQGADSASAQFFFVTGPKGSNLDAQGTYVTFGHVSSGLDVLQKIAAGPTKSLGQLGTTPDPPVTITSVTISQS